MNIFGLHICADEVMMVMPILAMVGAAWRQARFKVRLWLAERRVKR